MPQVVKKDIDHLNAVITVTVEKSEYEGKFKAELNKYRKQATMKGFRKGKTPLSVLRKMYGKAVLSEVINEILQTEVGKYLTDNELNYLGQPLPNEDQVIYDFDPRDLEDFEFIFDLGLAPDFEVQGLGEDESFPINDVKVPEEKIEEELSNARKRLGKQVAVEGDIEDNDLIKLNVKELDGDQVKEDGLTHEFSVPADRLTDDAKAIITQHKTGDSFRLNLNNLEKETSPDYVRQYFWGITEDAPENLGEEAEVTIQEISRLAEAEMDEEFFKQLFGEGEVSTEAEAKEKIESNLKGYYDRQAEALMFRSLQEHLLAKNPMEFPEGFLKRWLKTGNENVTEAQIETEFPDFKENLQWTLIRSKLAKQHEVTVNEEEIKAVFKQQILGMVSDPSMFDDAFLESMAARFMEKQEDYDRVAQQILTDKVFKAVKETIKLEPKEISAEDLENLIKEINEVDQAKQLARQAATEVAGEEE